MAIRKTMTVENVDDRKPASSHRIGCGGRVCRGQGLQGGVIGEVPDEGVGLAVDFPVHSQASPAELVGNGVGRHGMGEFGQRRVIDVFISAKVVLGSNGAGLDSGQVPGLQLGRPVRFTLSNRQVDGRGFDGHHVPQQLGSHGPSEGPAKAARCRGLARESTISTDFAG